MKAVAGIFVSPSEAQGVARELHAMGLTEDKVAVLLPGQGDYAVPIGEGEQPGVSKVIGSTVGAAAGAASGFGLGMAVGALISGVGPVMVTGFLGAALLGLAGARMGAAVGEAVENALAEGVPEDEWFVYEDALRQDRNVVIVLAGDESTAESIRGLLVRRGAETIDAAREKWWIGLRDAERERYTAPGGDFQRDEVFFRLGFQAALQARARGKEYDQVRNEMAEELQELKRRCPSSEIEKPFRRGYERGRAYYESLRGNKSQ
jgi:hypothetical protein